MKGQSSGALRRLWQRWLSWSHIIDPFQLTYCSKTSDSFFHKDVKKVTAKLLRPLGPRRWVDWALTKEHSKRKNHSERSSGLQLRDTLLALDRERAKGITMSTSLSSPPSGFLPEGRLLKYSLCRLAFWGKEKCEKERKSRQGKAESVLFPFGRKEVEIPKSVWWFCGNEKATFLPTWQKCVAVRMSGSRSFLLLLEKPPYKERHTKILVLRSNTFTWIEHRRVRLPAHESGSHSYLLTAKAVLPRVCTPHWLTSGTPPPELISLPIQDQTTSGCNFFFFFFFLNYSLNRIIWIFILLTFLFVYFTSILAYMFQDGMALFFQFYILNAQDGAWNKVNPSFFPQTHIEFPEAQSQNHRAPCHLLSQVLFKGSLFLGVIFLPSVLCVWELGAAQLIQNLETCISLTNSLKDTNQ